MPTVVTLYKVEELPKTPAPTVSEEALRFDEQRHRKYTT